ncbi:uncharacterized protein LOC133288142 [Gastrolobium bilobum]|uniref:uncharacterized protein LOC133288142 n=1 Tax=Gastrolobium bilobum TaxID=150636 RepID=UPI002AB24448|nr:uncharacterized protein LOC133288142 [Gastrolobium bilobum]
MEGGEMVNQSSNLSEESDVNPVQVKNDGSVKAIVHDIPDPGSPYYLHLNPRISDLHDEINKLQQGDNSVSDYYTKLKILWDELEALQPTPACLNEQFTHVRSQIMLMDPLPNVNRVFSLVTQQERQMVQLEGNMPKLETSKVFYNFADQAFERGRGITRGRGRGFSTGRGRTGGSRLCTYCGKTSHTVDTYFEKHGYPPGYRQRNPTHKENVATVTDQDQRAEIQSSINPTDEGKDKFTKYQYQTILDMIQQQMQRQNSTTHMSNVVRTKAYNMNTESSESPGVANLASVLVVQHRICIIQQTPSMKMIGSAELERGLYVLKQNCKCEDNSSNNRKDNLKTERETGFSKTSYLVENCIDDVWHLRLVHCSKAIIRAMMLHYPFIKCKNIDGPCDTCHLARQKRLNFPISHTVSSSAFDLMHIDI